MIRSVVILGGGSAGFMAAVSLKSKLPSVKVQVLRSPEIGIIGVGEGSTGALTSFLHKFLNVDRKSFFAQAQPTWKLGLKFLWGKRPYFNYTFGPGLDVKSVPSLQRPNGFYCQNNIEYTDPYSALMTCNTVFERRNNLPVIHDVVAYHFENEKFVSYLQGISTAAGVEILDATVKTVLQDESGISGLVLEDGKTLTADLYVDASGFRSELLGKTLGEPFISFKDTLFCDRAVIGGWQRSGPEDQTIKPYTTCETMDSGWCWQIEHENRINRGYVYSSAFVSDEQAELEFRARNPKVTMTRGVGFISGRYERAWVKNVVAIGNASGFVEPLEATALGNIAVQCRSLTEALALSNLNPGPLQARFFNRLNAVNWDSTRGFLGVHYKFNNRVNTPFWEHCRQETNLAAAEEIVSCYQELGPEGYWGLVAIDQPYDQFAIGGYITLLTGMEVPWRVDHAISLQEHAKFDALRLQYKEIAMRAMPVRDAIAAVRSPEWRWQ